MFSCQQAAYDQMKDNGYEEFRVKITVGHGPRSTALKVDCKAGRGWVTNACSVKFNPMYGGYLDFQYPRKPA